MAGDWIKMRADLMDDPAVFQIRHAIGDDRLQIIGRLHLFWAWADKHAVDGVVDGATSLLVDDIAGKDGFASALVKAKWLCILPSGIQLPHADRHNGESAKERSLKNARQARWRHNKASGASTAPSTTASTREEKRREEVNTPSPFDRFWTAYPKKVGKDAAKKAFDKRGVSGALLAEMLAAVEAQRQSPGWQRDGGQYIPNPATWLNEGRWQDEPDAPNAGNVRKLVL